MLIECEVTARKHEVLALYQTAQATYLDVIREGMHYFFNHLIEKCSAADRCRERRSA